MIIMYTQNGGAKRGRHPYKSLERRNLMIAYLLGKTERETAITVGPIREVNGKIYVIGEKNKESTYKAAIAEKIFQGVKGNKRTLLNTRILKPYRKWFIELEKTRDAITDAGKIELKRKAKKFLAVNIETIKNEVNTQSNDKNFREHVEWFFEPLGPNKIRIEEMDSNTIKGYLKLKEQGRKKSSQFKKLDFEVLKRFYLFKQFYDFSKELYGLRKKPVSFNNLFNTYLLHIMFSILQILRSKKVKIKNLNVSPLLIWKAFGDTFNEGYKFAFGAFTIDWIKNLSRQMESSFMFNKSFLEELFIRCNEYFSALLDDNEKGKIPETITTVTITDISITFLQKLKEAKNWSKIFQ